MSPRRNVERGQADGCGEAHSGACARGGDNSTLLVLGNEFKSLELKTSDSFRTQHPVTLGIDDPLNLQFVADKYGPYSERLRHLLNNLDGTYLHCDKRLSDAGPSDTISFNEERRNYVDLYFKQDAAKTLRKVLDLTAKRIDGFESPLGMELLATVDWLIAREQCEPSIAGIREGLSKWPAGKSAADRKLRILDGRLIDLALRHLVSPPNI